MVVKRTSTKKVSAGHTKATKPFGYVVSAIFSYGPFKSKTDADAHRKQASAIKGAEISPLKKSAKGYFYQSFTHIGARTAVEKAKAVATIKREAPSARIKVTKAK